MKKISLIIFPGNFLPHIGGLETHVDEFCNYLSKNKIYNITIFTPDITCKAKKKEIIYNNVIVIRYPAIELVPNFPFPKIWSLTFWKLFLNLYKNRYDIVMTRTRFFSNSTLGLFFSKFRFNCSKLIHVEHGSDYVKVRSKISTKFAWFYDKTFGKLLFKLADKNIAISQAVYNFIKNEFNIKNLSIIKRGIDMSVINKEKKDLKLKNKFKNKIIICYIGRLYKWKGLDNTILAYKTVPKKIKEKSVFLIGGYGEDENRLKKLAKNDLNKNIFFLGKISLGKNFQIMKSSHIHIHSAYPGGGLSSTLLQFMYCKNAIVASPYEGAKEVIENGKNGILLKNNSVKELSKGLKILIENKDLREKYSNEAKKYITQNFDWNKVILKYDKLLKEVLK